MATLQQLRYLIAVAEYGSITPPRASCSRRSRTFPRPSKTSSRRLGVTIFTRSNRRRGADQRRHRALGYARQVIEQADMLERRYAEHGSSHVRPAVSTQHYAFSVQAFVNGG